MASRDSQGPAASPAGIPGSLPSRVRRRPGTTGLGAGGCAERADGAPCPGPSRVSGLAGPDRPRPREGPRAPGSPVSASAWPCCCARGNAGSDTFTGHKEVLAAAIGQVPARFRRKILIRVGGAGASHELARHLLSLSSLRRALPFTCGWMITITDEDAIRQIPAGARKPGIAQDGGTGQDKDPRSPGRSTAAGSSPRTSPSASPPGPVSSACATTRSRGKPARTRPATGSGTSPPASPSARVAPEVSPLATRLGNDQGRQPRGLPRGGGPPSVMVRARGLERTVGGPTAAIGPPTAVPPRPSRGR
jgi:hypothetical protein